MTMSEGLKELIERIIEEHVDVERADEVHDDSGCVVRINILHGIREAADAIISAISSQTSPQGKQGVRTEHARLGSQEATPNTGVKLEGGGG